MKQHDPRRKLLILSLLVLGIIAVLATGTYAAYTSSAKLKRVAVARMPDGSSGLCFSSNLLDPYSTEPEDEYIIRTIRGGTGPISFSFTVCNYPQDDPTRVNSSTIEYSIAVINSLSNCTYTLNTDTGTLEENLRSKNIHTVTVTPDENSDISTGYIQVVVSPKEGSSAAVDNKKLAARFKLIPTTAGESDWKGDIILNGDYADNDMINYRIYGTKECEMNLVWNNQLVGLSEWSKAMLNVSEGSSDNPLRISLGQPGTPTSYVLQFYRVAPPAEGESSISLGIYLNPITP